jgi:hypothetical protein
VFTVRYCFLFKSRFFSFAPKYLGKLFGVLGGPVPFRLQALEVLEFFDGNNGSAPREPVAAKERASFALPYD